MKINSDFSQRVVVHSAQNEWIKSPMKGVYRRPLDRIGAEVARATSIVKYAPKSHFSAHVHSGGEEFFVLEGVFQDEHGDYPAGSYIRNPPQSKHIPGSDLGCVILVKLWQFEPEDRTHVQLNTNYMEYTPHRDIENVSVISLYKDQHEEVSLQQWDENSTIIIESSNGLEVFVIEGSFIEGEDHLETQSWLRLPPNSKINAKVGSQSAKVLVKQNHLKNVDEQIFRVSNRK